MKPKRTKERDQMRRKGLITHIESEPGRTVCGRPVFNDTKITQSDVYTCLMCERTKKRSIKK